MFETTKRTLEQMRLEEVQGGSYWRVTFQMAYWLKENYGAGGATSNHED
jgi:hypothetical protein